MTLEIVRDRPSLALLFIAPLVMSGLITFIIREGDTPTIDAVLVNQAGLPGTLVAAQLGTAIEGEGGSFEILDDEAAARSAVERGDASIAAVLPAGLGRDAAAQLTLITDGLDPLGEATQVGKLQRTIMAGAAAASGGSLPIDPAPDRLRRAQR